MESDKPCCEQSTCSSESTPTPEKAIQDLFQWFGKIASEYTVKLNENTSESIDVIGKDLKKLYSKIETMIVQGQDVVKMSAQDIRKRTVEELYQTIKVNVLCHRDVCKCVHETVCVSTPILEEVKKMLVEEGFEVNYVISESSTNITVQW
jgi:hypothetical protein